MTPALLILAPAGIAAVSLALNVYLAIRLGASETRAGSAHALNRGRRAQIRHLQRELARLRSERAGVKR